jgi:ferredoxin--NADP+ reductase
MTITTQGAQSKPAATEVLNATVTQRQDINEYLSIVRVRPDSGHIPDFKPGQFATLGLPRQPKQQEIELLRKHGKEPRVRITRRAYSIASTPGDDYLEFFVILVKEGRLTPQLWSVPEGGRLWMHEEIKGEFTLDAVPEGRDLVMVSTGTGLAPYLSMYRQFRNTNRWRTFTVINGVRHVCDLGYVEELNRYQEEDPNFTYIPLVSRATAEDAWDGVHGRVNVLLEGDAYEKITGRTLDPAQASVFLCGNPAMIDDMEAELIKLGFTVHTHDQPGNIHFERYW